MLSLGKNKLSQKFLCQTGSTVLWWSKNVVVPLLAGAWIYGIWRSPTLRFGRWIEAMNGEQMWWTLRSVFASCRSGLPDWFLYSLPDMLWAFALGAGFARIWGRPRATLKCAFVLLGLVATVGAEVGQAVQLVPGVFDLIDLIGSFLGYCLGLWVGTPKVDISTGEEQPWWGFQIFHATRPSMLPYVIMLPLLGAGYALWDNSIACFDVNQMCLLLLGWTLLHAGTMLLNSVFDRDEGPVLWGRSDAVVPGVMPTARISLGLAWMVALLLGGWPGWALSLCVLLAILYSGRGLGWKSKPIGGPFVNWFGYGFLSPTAGFFAVGGQVKPSSYALILLFSIAILSLYFLAQCFQEEEDRRRGYRTYVAIYGAHATVRLSKHLYLISVLGFYGMAAFGIYPRLCLAVFPIHLAIFLRLHWPPSKIHLPWVHRTVERLLFSGMALIALVGAQWVFALNSIVR